MITLEQYMMGRDKAYPPTPEQVDDADDLLDRVSLLEYSLGEEFVLTGGYRPEKLIELHMLPGCAHDAHSKCKGIDLHDPGLVISRKILENQDLLLRCNLWMESPISAKDHLHLQSYPPHSNKRIFIA